MKVAAQCPPQSAQSVPISQSRDVAVTLPPFVSTSPPSSHLKKVQHDIGSGEYGGGADGWGVTCASQGRAKGHME